MDETITRYERTNKRIEETPRVDYEEEMDAVKKRQELQVLFFNNSMLLKACTQQVQDYSLALKLV